MLNEENGNNFAKKKTKSRKRKVLSQVEYDFSVECVLVQRPLASCHSCLLQLSISLKTLEKACRCWENNECEHKFQTRSCVTCGE